MPVLQSGIKWLEDNVDNTATCIIPTAEQLASGWLAWQLQLNCGIQTWGQNISTDPKDAYPVIGGSVLYAEGPCTGDHSAATSFSNDPSVVTHNLTHYDAVPATCSQRVTTNIGIAAIAKHTLRSRSVKMPTLMMQMQKRACG